MPIVFISSSWGLNYNKNIREKPEAAFAKMEEFFVCKMATLVFRLYLK